MNKIEVDDKPWKDAKPIQGFLHFIGLFRRNEKNGKDKNKNN